MPGCVRLSGCTKPLAAKIVATIRELRGPPQSSWTESLVWAGGLSHLSTRIVQDRALRPLPLQRWSRLTVDLCIVNDPLGSAATRTNYTLVATFFEAQIH